jgi:hypothetical protein
MDIQVTLPGGGVVAALTQRARFYRDEYGIDRVEISAVGSKDTAIRKVGPREMAMFKAEWDAYCDGREMTQRPGTPLSEVDGVNDQKVNNYILRNIHNAEELAALSDSQCQALGHGVLTDRKAAQAMLVARQVQQDAAERDRVAKAAEKIGPAKVEAAPEVAELGKKIDALAEGIGALVGLLTAQAEKKKPGRPPKPKDE